AAASAATCSAVHGTEGFSSREVMPPLTAASMTRGLSMSTVAQATGGRAPRASATRRPGPSRGPLPGPLSHPPRSVADVAELYIGGRVDPATHQRTGDDVRLRS